jgi:hypothetical protein
MKQTTKQKQQGARGATCPIDFGGGWAPDELTLEDAREVVLSCCGLGNGHTDDDVLGLLWRFRALTDEEAVVLLRSLRADIERGNAALRNLGRGGEREGRVMSKPKVETAVRADKFARRRDYFLRAAKGEMSEEENAAAWREYSALAARVFNEGRLWLPGYVYFFAPLVVAVADELDENDRLQAAMDAAGEDAAAVAEIARDWDGVPPLEIVDRLALALECDPDEPRQIAGYLTTEAQPVTAVLPGESDREGEPEQVH